MIIGRKINGSKFKEPLFDVEKVRRTKNGKRVTFYRRLRWNYDNFLEIKKLTESSPIDTSINNTNDFVKSIIKINRKYKMLEKQIIGCINIENKVKLSYVFEMGEILEIEESDIQAYLHKSLTMGKFTRLPNDSICLGS